VETTELTVRQANAADVAALVELRIANAEAHVALDPDTYRVPSRDAVARHFAAVLADTVLANSGREDAVFVAETTGGRVLGMVEVLRHSGPPEHQILRPEPSAEVHTVVLGDARGGGTGAALLAVARNDGPPVRASGTCPPASITAMPARCVFTPAPASPMPVSAWSNGWSNGHSRADRDAADPLQLTGQ
jgi:GNAT superfamily N-acetyltransferase